MSSEGDLMSVIGCKTELVDTLEGHEDRVWCVQWHPKEPSILASCSGDKTVRLWSQNSQVPEKSGSSWRCINTLQGEHAGTVRRIAWSPSGRYLACASFDRTVSIYQQCSPQFDFELQCILDGHENEVKCVTWASDMLLATCSRDRSIWLWERVHTSNSGLCTEGGDAGLDMELEPEFECAGVLVGHTQDVKSVSWVSLGNRNTSSGFGLISCGYDGTIKLWNETEHRKDDWHCADTLSGHSGTVWQCLPSPDGTILSSVSDDLSLKLWSLHSPNGKAESNADAAHGLHWSLAASFSGFATRPIYDVSWDPKGRFVACASGDNRISLIAVKTAFVDSAVHPSLISMIHNAHNADVNTVHFSTPLSSGDECWMASGGDDNTVRIWRLSKFEA